MLTRHRLKEVLDYNPITGIFTWRITLSSRALAGKRAGNISRHGDHLYRKIRIDTVLHFEHRLAWLYMKGRWPKPEVDHEDLNGLNNIWTNLRRASRTQNMGNRSLSVKNQSGVKGVYFRRDTGKWVARIQFHHNTTNLGCYTTKEEAAAEYRKAAEILYGQFARAS